MERKLLTESAGARNVRWMVQHPANMYLYYALCVMTGGVLYALCSMMPSVKTWFLMSETKASNSTFAFVSHEGETVLATVIHHSVGEQHIVSLEARGRRFWTSAQDNWELVAVTDAPRNFSSLLFPSTTAAMPRDLVQAYYGRNVMELPDHSFWDILAETIFHPFYVFQYFAVSVWLAEYYIEYSLVILVITGGAIYLTASETVSNLKRLRDLAGMSHPVQLIDPQTKELREVMDTELVPGDRFVVPMHAHIPCDAVLVAGRVSVDESMLTGECVPVNKAPVEETIFCQGTDDATALARHPGNVLFCGTKVVRTSATTAGPASCVAVVYRTGFRSAKGQLVATLLHPKDNFLTFFSDTLWVIFYMVIVSTGLYFWSAVYLEKNGVPWSEISLYYLDTLTFAIPPALTACLTVATGISIARLGKRNIFVSESNRVNWAGLVSVACFDKTGTLTEEKLNFRGIAVPQSTYAPSMTELDAESVVLWPTDCIVLMGTCHSLSLVDGSPQGDQLDVELFRVSGFTLEAAPLDETDGLQRSFLTTDPSQQYTTLRHFEFTSDKTRSGSLVQAPNGEVTYYVKGSPETITSLIRNKATIPEDITETLNNLSKRGLRVVAFAKRILPNYSSETADLDISVSSGQDDIESDLTFVGLAYLSNTLKQDTCSTISTLQNAGIACNMITGDHIFTAIAVAKECGLVRESMPVYVLDAPTDYDANVTELTEDVLVDIDLDSFLSMPRSISHVMSPGQDVIGHVAVTGRGLNFVRKKFPHMLHRLLQHTQVFARMKPGDKQFIVEALQHPPREENISDHSVTSATDLTSHDMEEGRGCDEPTQVERGGVQDGPVTYVLFCGDGANDMAALRAATVGVSLCEAETSVAAPVTSRSQSPTAVVDVVMEGRCSLITAYVLVCFNIMYAIIGLFSLIMTYYYGLRMGNYTYFVQDLVFSLILGLAIADTGPYAVLDRAMPPPRLFTMHLTFRLVSQLVCCCCFQVLALEILGLQSWYHRFELDDEEEPVKESYTYESSVIADMGLAQIMIASVVSTIGKPFRKSWYENKTHIVAFVFQFSYLSYQIFGDDTFLRSFLDIKHLPPNFGLLMVLIIAGNWLTCLSLVAVGDALFLGKK